MKLNITTINGYLFFAALLINFFCLLNSMSNTLPLTIMACCCLPTLLDADRPRFTWYHTVFLLFIAYLFLHNAFIFPDEKTFAFRRRAVLAFLAGIAAFQLLKADRMRFMYLMNMVMPFVAAGLAAVLALGYVSYESLFNTSSRFVLYANHPTTIGMMLCVCIVAGLHFLFDKGAVNNLGWRPTDVLNRIFQSKTIVICGMFLSIALLLPTFSKTAMLTTAIVGGLFIAYAGWRRWGLLRGGGVCAALMLGALVAWHVAPIEPSQKERFSTAVLDDALTPWEYETFHSRKPVWESGVLAVKEHPLFGIGVNGFASFHQNRVRADYDRLVETYGKDLIDGDTANITTPHNVYLLWFAETGLIGGALFCVLFITPLVYCVVKKTLYGEVGLILFAYSIDFFFDDLMAGGRASSFCVTTVFMIFGYFSCIISRKHIQT